MFNPVWNRQSSFPARESKAMKFPSRLAANTTPPCVARTPAESVPMKNLYSHSMLPVSGLMALMPPHSRFGAGSSCRLHKPCPFRIHWTA